MHHIITTRTRRSIRLYEVNKDTEITVHGKLLSYVSTENNASFTKQTHIRVPDELYCVKNYYICYY